MNTNTNTSNTTIKHYALTTRTLARLFTNHLKTLGYTTTQPRSKVKTRKGTLTLDKGVKPLENKAQTVTEHYLVSTNTKIKKPCKKVTFNVVNNQAIQA